MKIIILILTYTVCLCRATTILDKELYERALDEELCVHQLETLRAFGFYDSSFRAPQGLLELNLNNFGNFDQCLQINREYRGRNVEGKYCLIDAPLTSPTLRMPSLGTVSESNNLTWTEYTVNFSEYDLLLGKPDTGVSSTANSTNPALQAVKLRLGICVPKTCTVDAVLRPYAEHPLIRFNYSEKICRLPGDHPYLAADYTGLAIFALFGLLTVASTAYELHYVFVLKRDPAKGSELLRCCSLYSNTKRLLTFKQTTRSLDVLDGIRAASVLWIIMYHSTSNMLNTLSIHDTKILRAIANGRYLMWSIVGPIAVDTFFVLSGLLLVYTAAYKNQQLTWRNLPEFYMNRYMRLFPLMAAVVLLQSSVFYRFIDGPGELVVMKCVEYCRRYWWSTLLHLQNFINPMRLCLMHVWYLSVDMQLYIVSPLVLYWVLRSRRAAWTALATAIFASLAGTLAFCFSYNFALPSLGMNSGYNYTVWYYQNPVTRSPPFFIGMLFGYILYVYGEKKPRLSKAAHLDGEWQTKEQGEWSVFFCYSVSLLFSLTIFAPLGLGYDNQVVINLHNALFRSCWAVALCWVIFACAHGYGGPVNWFLSLKLWQLIARISYAMYLFSGLIQFTELGSVNNQYYVNSMSIFTMFASDLLFTLVLAVSASIIIEPPVATLYKLVLNRIHKAASTPTDQKQTNGTQHTEVSIK